MMGKNAPGGVLGELTVYVGNGEKLALPGDALRDAKVGVVGDGIGEALDVSLGEGRAEEGVDPLVFSVRMEVLETGEDSSTSSRLLEENRTLEDLKGTDVLMGTLGSPSASLSVTTILSLSFAGELLGVTILNPNRRGRGGVDGPLGEAEALGAVGEMVGVEPPASSRARLLGTLFDTQVFLLLAKG